MSNKPVKAIYATFDDKRGPRKVIVLDADGLTGTAFVRPTVFNLATDPAIDYHGFVTSFENLHNITAVYGDGEVREMGEPRYRISTKSPQYLSVQN